MYESYYRCNGGMFHRGHSSHRVVEFMRAHHRALHDELFGKVEPATAYRVAELLVPGANLASTALRGRRPDCGQGTAWVATIPYCVLPHGTEWCRGFGKALEEASKGLQSMYSARPEHGGMELYISFALGRGPATLPEVLALVEGALRSALERQQVEGVRVARLQDNPALSVPYMARLLALQRLVTTRAFGRVVALRRQAESGVAVLQTSSPVGRGLDLAVYDKGDLAFDALVRCLSLGTASFVRAMTPHCMVDPADYVMLPGFRCQYDHFTSTGVMLSAARECRCFHFGVRYAGGGPLPVFLRHALLTVGSLRAGVYMHVVEDEASGMAHVLLVAHAHVHPSVLDASVRGSLQALMLYTPGATQLELVPLTPFDPTSRLDPVAALFGATAHKGLPTQEELDRFHTLVTRAVRSAPRVEWVMHLDKHFQLFKGKLCRVATTRRLEAIQAKQHLVLVVLDAQHFRSGGAASPPQVGQLPMTRFQIGGVSPHALALFWNDDGVTRLVPASMRPADATMAQASPGSAVASPLNATTTTLAVAQASPVSAVASPLNTTTATLVVARPVPRVEEGGGEVVSAVASPANTTTATLAVAQASPVSAVASPADATMATLAVAQASPVGAVASPANATALTVSFASTVAMGPVRRLTPADEAVASGLASAAVAAPRTRAELDKTMDDARDAIHDAIEMIQPVLAYMGRVRERGIRVDLSSIRSFTSAINEAAERYDEAGAELHRLRREDSPPAKRARLEDVAAAALRSLRDA